MPDQILIALGAIVISGLSYFAGVYRTRKQLDKTEREARINRVATAYLALVQAVKTSGCDGLLKAGVATLKSDEEVRATLERIEKHGQKSPIAAEAAKLEGVDLSFFFAIAAERQHNFFRGDLDKLIADTKERQKAK